MEWIKIFSSAREAMDRVREGATQLIIVRGVSLCLARHRNIFFAVQDSCSHNGESLSKGKINHLGEVVCPWHGYRFELKSGKASDSSSPELKTYPVKIDESGFFIGL